MAESKWAAAKTILFGVGWLFVMAWFCVWWMGNPLHKLHLIQRGATVGGAIVDSSEDVGDNGAGHAVFSFELVYRFKTPGGTEFYSRYHGDGRLPGKFRDASADHPIVIEVEYLPDDPEISRIKGSGSESLGQWLWRDIGIGGLIAVILLWPGVMIAAQGVRQLRGVEPLGQWSER